MAIDWNQIYQQKWNESQAGYDKAEQDYKNAQAAEQLSLDNTLNAGRQSLAKTRDEAYRQAYITKMQNEREMPALLKQNGINGGASETSAAALLRNYQNSRNSASNAYSQGDTDLTNTYNTNTSALKSRYNTLLAELRQKRQDDIWSQTQFAYDAAKKEEEAAEEKRRYELQQQLEREKMEEEKRRWEAEMAFQQQQLAAQLAAASSGGGYGGGSYYSGGGGSTSGGSSGTTAVGNSKAYSTPGGTDKYAWQNQQYSTANKSTNSPMNGSTSSKSRVTSNPTKVAQTLLAIQKAKKKK